MERLNGVCVVAHPDDCIIFARPLILYTKQIKWHIVYMTYQATDSRAQEISSYWGKRQVTTEFLGYEDNYLDNTPSGYLKFWHNTDVRIDISNKISHADIVLTHNPDGDYGHIHHMLVSDCARFAGIPAIFFAKHTQSNKTITTSDIIDYEEIPLHTEVVRQFENINTKWYYLTAEAERLLNGIT